MIRPPSYLQGILVLTNIWMENGMMRSLFQMKCLIFYIAEAM